MPRDEVDVMTEIALSDRKHSEMNPERVKCRAHEPHGFALELND